MGLFFKGAKITQIHGQMRKVDDRFVIAMFHPALRCTSSPQVYDPGGFCQAA